MPIAAAARVSAVDRYPLPTLHAAARLPLHADEPLLDLHARDSDAPRRDSLTACGAHYIACATRVCRSAWHGSAACALTRLLQCVSGWMRREGVMPGSSPAAWEGGKPGLTWRRHMHRVMSVAQDVACVVTVAAEAMQALSQPARGDVEALLRAVLAHVHECKLLTLGMMLEVMYAHAPALFAPLVDTPFTSADAPARRAISAACASMHAVAAGSRDASSSAATSAHVERATVPTVAPPRTGWCCGSAPARDTPPFLYSNKQEDAHAQVPDWAREVEEEAAAVAPSVRTIAARRPSSTSVYTHVSAWQHPSHHVHALLRGVLAPFLAATCAWKGNTVATQLFRVMLDIVYSALAGHTCMQRVELTVTVGTSEPRVTLSGGLYHRIPVLVPHRSQAASVSIHRALACALDLAFIHEWVAAGCPCILAPPTSQPLRTVGTPSAVTHHKRAANDSMSSPQPQRNDLREVVSPVSSAGTFVPPSTGAAAMTRSPATTLAAGAATLVTAAMQMQLPAHVAEASMLRGLHRASPHPHTTHAHIIAWLFAAHAQDAGAGVGFLAPSDVTAATPGAAFLRAWARTCLARAWAQCLSHAHVYAASGKESFLLAASPVRAHPRKYPRGSVVPITDDTPGPAATPQAADIIASEDAAEDDDVLRECARREGRTDDALVAVAPSAPHHGRVASGFARAAAAIDDASQPTTPAPRVMTAWGAADDALTPSIHVNMDASAASPAVPAHDGSHGSSVQHGYVFQCGVGESASPWVEVAALLPQVKSATVMQACIQDAVALLGAVWRESSLA